MVDITDAEAVLAAHTATENQIVDPGRFGGDRQGPIIRSMRIRSTPGGAFIDINLERNLSCQPRCRACHEGARLRPHCQRRLDRRRGRRSPTLRPTPASKAGVIGLTKSLGKELAADIVKLHHAGRRHRAPIFNQMKQEHIDYHAVAKIPRARFLEVDEAATHQVAWLVSKENSFTTASVSRSLRRPRHLLTADFFEGNYTLFPSLNRLSYT